MSILNIFKEKCVDAFNRSKLIFTHEWSWWSIDLLFAHNRRLVSEYGIAVAACAVISIPFLVMSLLFLTFPPLWVGSIFCGAIAGLFLIPAIPTLMTNVVLPAVNIITNVGLAAANTILSLVIVPVLTLKDIIKEAYNERVSGYYDKVLSTMTSDEFENYVVTPLKNYTPTSAVSCELKNTITETPVEILTKKAKVSLFIKNNLSRGLTSHLFFAFETIENEKALQRNKVQDATVAQNSLDQNIIGSKNIKI